MPYAAASDLSNQRLESLLLKLSVMQLRSKYSKVSTSKPLKREYSVEYRNIMHERIYSQMLPNNIMSYFSTFKFS